jgi:hypothetical protein
MSRPDPTRLDAAQEQKANCIKNGIPLVLEEGVRLKLFLVGCSRKNVEIFFAWAADVSDQLWTL